MCQNECDMVASRADQSKSNLILFHESKKKGRAQFRMRKHHDNFLTAKQSLSLMCSNQDIHDMGHIWW